MKIPKGIPKRPPAPSGYLKWQYMGIGYVSPQKEPVIFCHVQYTQRPMGGFDKSDMAVGGIKFHYFRAVKRKTPISLREFSRRGGKANTPAQNAARAQNGKKGGRKPSKQKGAL